MKQSVTVGAQLLWSSRYGCNNDRYGCTIVMSYIEINKAVSQWLLTFNLCVSATWPLTCAFHIPCMHTPEIIDMHRGMCDNNPKLILIPNLAKSLLPFNNFLIAYSFWHFALSTVALCAKSLTWVSDVYPILNSIPDPKHPSRLSNRCDNYIELSSILAVLWIFFYKRSGIAK